MIKKSLAIIIFVLSLSLNVHVHGLLSFNQGCKAFPNQCDDSKNKSSSSPTLGQLIIEAAGYFLQSHSDYKFFLKKVELSEINGIKYDEMQIVLNNTISSMELASNNYLEIWEISQTIEYEPLVIERLKSFDYAKYESENNLIPSIFYKVESFLNKGDVRGIFQKAYNDSCEILEKVKDVKKEISAKKMPELSKLWRSNQSYIEFDLFGQYVSEVFIKMD
jgi:hypothetical protein